MTTEPPSISADHHGIVADSPYQSFWMGGYEGADHVNGQGRALDMVDASGHLDHLETDYARMAAWGLRSVRESVGWRLSECSRGRFDFSRARHFAQRAQAHGLQVLWTLMHYGTPADVSMLDDSFAERFADFAAAAAAALAPYTPAPPVYTPINEISFLAWAASQTDLLQGYAPEHADSSGSSRVSGYHIKCRLVKAVLMAMDAIRSVDSRARFLHIEPVVHVVAPVDRPDLAPLAEEVRSYQWQAWDMLAGRMAPELGGHPEALDLIGVNHYHSGQWEVETERRLAWHLRDPRRRPFAELLDEVWQRYRRPVMVAETSHFGVGRGDWLNDIAAQVLLARHRGVPVQGLCLYPIVDRPDWNDADHWHHSGLWDHEPVLASGLPSSTHWPRRLNLPYARALKRWQACLPQTSTSQGTPCSS